MPNYSPEHYPPKEKLLQAVFGDWSQSEKLSEIKPPLGDRNRNNQETPN